MRQRIISQQAVFTRRVAMLVDAAIVIESFAASMLFRFNGQEMV